MKFTCLVLTKANKCFFSEKITFAEKKYCFKHLLYHHSREELINTVRHYNLLENPYAENNISLVNSILDSISKGVLN